MIELSAWIERYVELVGATFGNRVRFVGLQGSHGRGEATEASDIDMVVVLDTLDPADIAAYDAMLDALDHRELACGFLCGWEELLRWEPSDLFQFCHDTTPLLDSFSASRRATPFSTKNKKACGLGPGDSRGARQHPLIAAAFRP